MNGLEPTPGIAALRSAADASLSVEQLRRRVLIEVCLATATVGACIAAIGALAALWAPLSGWSGALIALTFLGLPIVIGGARGLLGDPLGIGRVALRPAVGLAIGVTLVIAGPFALGFDILQVQISGHTRGAGPGLLSYGLEMQQPPSVRPGTIELVEHGVGIALHNGLERPIRLRPSCSVGTAAATCRQRLVAAGSRDLLSPLEAQHTVIVEQDGQELRASVVAGGEPVVGGLVTLERNWSWLFWMLLTQLVVVGLPEEAFFRGYVLGRLLAAFPSQRMILGAPFGLAHVLSAALFAAIHLVSIPSPHRLLVFFPGLLFAWLASRARTTVAPTVFHALANGMLRVVGRFYG